MSDSTSGDSRLAERNIPGMNRHARFAEVEHAEDVGATLRRIVSYFLHEKVLVAGMLPSLFSGALTIVGTVLIMFWYCWQLALLSCATVILTVLVTKILSKQVRKFQYV